MLTRPVLDWPDRLMEMCSNLESPMTQAKVTQEGLGATSMVMWSNGKASLPGNSLNSTALVTNFPKLTFHYNLTLKEMPKALCSRCQAGHFPTAHLILSSQPLSLLIPPTEVEPRAHNRLGSGAHGEPRDGCRRWMLMEDPTHMLENNEMGEVLRSEQTR